MEAEIKMIEKNETSTESACGCGSGGCGSHKHQSAHHTHDHEIAGRFQLIQEGDRVVDLGCGLGNDSLLAAEAAGNTGKVIGIDISAENIAKARQKADNEKINNVEFREGNATDIPLPAEFANVVYATCLFNLQNDKQKVADEIYRICDHNGYACISDFVLLHDIPEGLRKDATAFAGAIGGAENVSRFMGYFQKTGFSKGGIVEVNKVKLPDDILEKHLDAEMIKNYNDINADEGIFSVVLVVEKPETCQSETCCHNPDKHKN